MPHIYKLWVMKRNLKSYLYGERGRERKTKKTIVQIETLVDGLGFRLLLMLLSIKYAFVLSFSSLHSFWYYMLISRKIIKVRFDERYTRKNV